MSNQSDSLPETSTLRDQLETALDMHGIEYATSTMKFIKGELSEDERDNWWGEADRASYSRLADLIDQSVVKELKDIITGLKRKPTHGPCCTCQDCGQDADYCNCDTIRILTSRLTDLEKESNQ